MTYAGSSFWCWSRKDYDENYLKTLNISIGYREETIIIDPFSTTFLYNGSHVKCSSEEYWAQTWVDISDQLLYVSPIPCVASTLTAPSATFAWDNYRKQL